MEGNTVERAIKTTHTHKKKRHMNRIKRSGQARLVHVFDINDKILHHVKVSPRGQRSRNSETEVTTRTQQ